MDCRHARDILLEGVTGTMVPEVRRALARHLQACASCRREAAVLEETVRMMREAPEPRLVPGHWETFMAGLDRALAADRSRLVRTVRWLRSPRHAWGTAAAAAALIVWLAFALIGGPPPAAEAPPAPVIGLMTESIVDAQPAMGGSLSVWKAGFGAAPYVLDDPPGGE